MPDAGLAFGGLGTGLKCIELLAWIVKTAQDAHQLKKECGKVGEIAKLLSKVLEGNMAVLKDAKTEVSLMKILVEVATFAGDCKEKNIVRRAWEMIWTKRLPELLKEMMMWIGIFDTELSVSLRARMMRLLEDIDDVKISMKEDAAAILERLNVLDELKKVQQDEESSGIHIDFSEKDDRLSVTKSLDLLRGKLYQKIGSTAGIDIICEPVDENLYSFGQGSRHALIYAKLSARTLVHPYYGIAQRFGSNWAVMKDLSKCHSLSQVIRKGGLPKKLPERLEIVRDIVTTVEYLHSVDILVKVLSENNVLLDVGEKGTTPYLTGLEKARLFKEYSVGGDYDVRYEAPELQLSRNARRDVYSDIWSLGLLIWSCMLGSIPFTSESDPGLENFDIEKIREAIASNQMPWTNKTYDDLLLNEILFVVESCCNPSPDARPSATEVADQLRRIQNLGPLFSKIGNLEEMKESISCKLANNTASTQLSEPEILALRSLSTNGDGTAAYLLGLAIKQDQAAPDDNAEQLLLISEADGLKERRSRSALAYMETAMRAGVKSAAEQLMSIHWNLMELYQAQAQQYRDLQSLSRERG